MLSEGTVSIDRTTIDAAGLHSGIAHSLLAYQPRACLVFTSSLSSYIPEHSLGLSPREDCDLAEVLWELACGVCVIQSHRQGTVTNGKF